MIKGAMHLRLINLVTGSALVRAMSFQNETLCSWNKNKTILVGPVHRHP